MARGTLRTLINLVITDRLLTDTTTNNTTAVVLC